MARLEPAGGKLTDGVVLLRHLRDDDARSIIDALGDEEISRWIQVIPFPYTNADATEFLSMAASLRASGVGTHLAIENAASGRFLGLISLLDLDPEQRHATAGYWVAREARGRGVATSALRLVSDWAFEVLAVERLELTTAVDNVASRRVAEKAGYRLEGIMRSHMKTRTGRRDSTLYSLLPTDRSY